MSFSSRKFDSEKGFRNLKKNFGFGLEHFSMVGDTAFFTLEEEFNREIFETIFVSHWLPAFEWNVF